MDILFSFLPVLLFLAFLFLLDSFRLVRVNTLSVSLAWGILSALAALLINPGVARWLNLDDRLLTRYVTPLIEEGLKALIIIWFIRRKRIGFMIDAAVYGFAAGAGFALVENVWYMLHYLSEGNPVTWLIRGLGTALMHGGATAILAVIMISLMGETGRITLSWLAGFLAASAIHSGFNHFLFSPLVQTLLILAGMPLVFLLVFRLSSRRLHQWLEVEFSSETKLLSMIRKGQLGTTRAGLYLLSVKDRFKPETVVDLYCFISLYLELSIKAKRNLMLRESGLEILKEEDLEAKLAELRHLRKNIGRMGELALAPLIRMNYRDLWKLNQIGNKGLQNHN